MKRRLSKLFTLAAAVSLLLCLATAGLWVGSFWTAGVLVWRPPGFLIIANSERNLIGLRIFPKYQGPRSGLHLKHYPNPDYKRVGGLWDEINNGLGGHYIHAIGLGYRTGEYSSATGGFGTRLSFHAPHWFVALVLATVPILWCYFVVVRPRGRANRGRCVACGYDLRATPDRCPECGTITQRSEVGVQRSERT